MRVADFEEGLYNIRVVPWRSGDATVCKTVYTGSIPVGTSRELRIKHCHKKCPDGVGARCVSRRILAILVERVILNSLGVFRHFGRSEPYLLSEASIAPNVDAGSDDERAEKHGACLESCAVQCLLLGSYLLLAHDFTFLCEPTRTGINPLLVYYICADLSTLGLHF